MRVSLVPKYRLASSVEPVSAPFCARYADTARVPFPTMHRTFPFFLRVAAFPAPALPCQCSRSPLPLPLLTTLGSTCCTDSGSPPRSGPTRTACSSSSNPAPAHGSSSLALSGPVKRKALSSPSADETTLALAMCCSYLTTACSAASVSIPTALPATSSTYPVLSKQNSWPVKGLRERRTLRARVCAASPSYAAIAPLTKRRGTA